MKLSLKYSNPATELLGDLVAQLVRVWQAICQVVGSSPSLSHCQFFFPYGEEPVYEATATDKLAMVIPACLHCVEGD